jgi:hypothetical protein
MFTVNVAEATMTSMRKNMMKDSKFDDNIWGLGTENGQNVICSRIRGLLSQ